MVEIAEQAVADAESAAMEPRRRFNEARRTESHLRQPLEAARARVNGLETEARTIARILASTTTGDFPPVADELSVDRGFETALGAALGDDLDSALDQPHLPTGMAMATGQGTRPTLWRKAAHRPCPRPAALTRALRQIGVVEEADALS